MEDFLASPGTPRETALENLRNSDVMILVIRFKAGSLLPNGTGSTYTSAEYDELLRLGGGGPRIRQTEEVCYRQHESSPLTCHTGAAREPGNRIAASRGQGTPCGGKLTTSATQVEVRQPDSARSAQVKCRVFPSVTLFFCFRISPLAIAQPQRGDARTGGRESAEVRTCS